MSCLQVHLLRRQMRSTRVRKTTKEMTEHFAAIQHGVCLLTVVFHWSVRSDVFVDRQCHSSSKTRFWNQSGYEYVDRESWTSQPKTWTFLQTIEHGHRLQCWQSSTARESDFYAVAWIDHQTRNDHRLSEFGDLVVSTSVDGLWRRTEQWHHPRTRSATDRGLCQWHRWTSILTLQTDRTNNWKGQFSVEIRRIDAKFSPVSLGLRSGWSERFDVVRRSRGEYAREKRRD